MFLNRLRHKRELIGILVSIGLFFQLCPNVQSADPLFSDNFSSSTTLVPSSGAWIQESGAYKQRETGTNFISQTDTALLNDDFAAEAPSTLTSPFSDSFTQADGAAAAWTVKRGALSVSSNTYYAPSGGGVTMSIPTDPTFNSWADYRVTGNFKRMGAADASGYSIFYFRATMSGSNDNSYALLLRQNGSVHFYKRVGGAYSTLLGTYSIAKDNNWHALTAEIVGSTFKMWLDKDYTTNAPDFAVSGLTDYTTGTIGVGTTSWASYFDDIQVTTVNNNYQFTEKRCNYWANSGTYIAIPGTCDGARTLAVLSNPASTTWKNYRISAQIKNIGALVSTNYSIINFRTTLVGNNDNSYAAIFRQNGQADVYEITNGWASSALLGTFTTLSDTNYHDIVLEVIGSSLKIWYDRSSTTQSPNFQFNHLTTYTAGSVGIGTYGAQSVFNSITVDPIVSLQPQPSFLYSGEDNVSDLIINSTDTSGDLTISVKNPSGTLWSLTNPAGCTGLVDCQVVFPTDFSGANITGLGTYTISIQRGNNISSSILEVREAPILTFVQISDNHYNSTDSTAVQDLDQLEFFASDINTEKYFPIPSFVVPTGDLTNDGTLVELAAVKTKFDTLTVPYYPIVGNHDTVAEVDGAMGTNWSNTFGSDKFSYSWTSGNYLFLAMDDAAPFGGYGSEMDSNAHKTWLQNILNANPTKKVILFSHYSLMEPRDAGGAQNFWLQGDSDGLQTILESHGDVLAQFAGHDHVNSIKNEDGIAYVTTSDFIGNDQYRYVEVYADKIVSQIMRADSYSYTREGALWDGSTDSTHTAETYSFGTPAERNFTIDYSAGFETSGTEVTSTIGNTIWKDYELSADITIRNDEILGQNNAGLLFRYVDSNNFYSALIDADRDIILLEKTINGVKTEISRHSITIATDTIYDLKVSILGSAINIYLNDVLELTSTDASVAAGKIGVSSYQALNEFDNVLVSSLDTTAPTVNTIVYKDNNGDGVIDQILITFTETVFTTSLGTSDFSYQPNGFSTGSVSNLVHETNSLTFTLNNSAVNKTGSSSAPTFTYYGSNYSGHGNTIIDAGENPVLAWTEMTIVDQASPVVVSVSPENSTTGNSRMANIVITFSESMLTTFTQNTQFTTSGIPGTFTPSWSSSNSVVTLSHGDRIGCATTARIALEKTEIHAASGLQTELVTTGPSTGNFSFTTLACSTDSSSSSSQVAPPETVITPVDEEAPPATEEEITRIDDDGRIVAIDSEETGISPRTGQNEAISIISAGQFIRSDMFSTVYYIDEDNLRHPFWDTNTYFTYADSFSDVVWVTDATIPTLFIGTPMLPKSGTVLVKIQSDPKVYAIEGDNVLRWIPDEATAISLYGAYWTDCVIDLEPTAFPHFAIGEALNVHDSVELNEIKTRETLAQLAE